MNTLNSITTNFKPSGGLLPLNLNRTFFPKPISTLNFKTPNFSLKASSSQNPNFTQKTEKPISWNPFKATVITTIAATAILFSRFCFPIKPSIAIAAPVNSATVEEEEEKDSNFIEETEKALEQQLVSNPDDVNALKNLMEIKIKTKKVTEAIEILDKLIEIEPEEVEWPMMKSHLYAYNEEFGLAKFGFNELLKKDPLRVEAYHGLVTVASQEESSEELANVERQVEEAMKLCRKEGKKSELRDFKLLFAQIRVLEGKYDEALKVYEELVKEEPRDFRPYLCEGIIYTLLRKNSEAEKSFEKYRRLVPKGHPYASYFDDNMIATKLFAQKVERESAMSNN